MKNKKAGIGSLMLIVLLLLLVIELDNRVVPSFYGLAFLIGFVSGILEGLPSMLIVKNLTINGTAQFWGVNGGGEGLQDCIISL